MTQVLELSDKDSIVAIVVILQQVKVNAFKWMEI